MKNPICPDCGNMLERVNRSYGERDGDWYCINCPEQKNTSTGYKYFWDSELEWNQRIEVSTNVAGHTLLGTRNCFSLYNSRKRNRRTQQDYKSVRIVNMYLEDFETIQASLSGSVEVELISPTKAIVIDSRVPNELRHQRWCTVCTPFMLLPLEQKRDYLRHWTPMFREGELTGWQSCVPQGPAISEKEIDKLLAQVGEYYTRER